MSITTPIFILGANRSGTSALHLALLHALKHKGYGEGHFFETILKMYECAEKIFDTEATKIKGTFIGNISHKDIKEGLHGFYAGIYKNYLGECFIDKTPTYAAIDSSPVINEVFPSARIIYMQRRGIENVASKQRKFPDQDFAKACNAWKSCINCWRGKKGLLNNYLEIDQYNLRHHLDKETERLKNYLELTQEEIDAVKKFLTEEKIEETGPNTVPSIDTVGFSDDEKSVFLEMCSDTMKEEGYSTSESYFLSNYE